MSVQTIDASTLKQWLEQDEVVVVDVREPMEYEAENITGATLIPLGAIAKSALPDVNNGRKLVLHCRSGKRSQFACEQLIQEDPSFEVYNLEGGILAWVARGYPVNVAS